ncbi:hypothetical protein PspLS_09985 [Pyricularia sp. CBS 133598]|nr:hypothetical protein PspLS_09985 [Pyricularia sp. CBS 133598]
MRWLPLTFLAVLANAPMIYAAGSALRGTIPSRSQEIAADQPPLVDQLVRLKEASTQPEGE